MTKINISIPLPCHENWQDMTAVEKGKFCNSCQKQVFDFTSSSDREIINAINKNKNLCGRFLNSQLDRDLVKPKEKSALWLATTTALISLIGVNEVTAQETPKTEQTDKKVLSDTINNEEIEVTGIVSDDTGPLPGANISIKGKSVKTQTDINGKYTIEAQRGDVLIATYIGYNDVEHQIIASKENNNLELKSTVSFQMTEAVVGGICVNRTFFGRIFHSIRNWFR